MGTLWTSTIDEQAVIILGIVGGALISSHDARIALNHLVNVISHIMWLEVWNSRHAWPTNPTRTTIVGENRMDELRLALHSAMCLNSGSERLLVVIDHLLLMLSLPFYLFEFQLF